MIWILAAAALTAPSAPAAQAVEGVEIIARSPVVGTLQQGVQAYRPEFFTPVRPSNAMDMIKWLPGFGFEDVRDLRGLGGVVGNVLIDGKPPTSKTDTLSSVLARIPANQVERVDLIVGGAPGIDMRGRDVIANIVMKPTARVKGVASLSTYAVQDGRLFPELLVSASRNNAGRAWDASLTVANRQINGPGFGDGTWVRRDGTGAIVFTADEFNRSNTPVAIATGSYEFPFAGGRLRANGSLGDQHSMLRDVAVLAGSGQRYTQNGDDILRRGEFGLRYERVFAKRTTLETQFLERLGHHENRFVTRRPPVLTDFSVEDEQRETVLRSTLRWKRDEGLTVEGSAEGAFNGLDTGSRLVSAGVDTPIPAANVRIREDRGEFGTLVSWKPSKPLGVTGALKVETSRLTAGGDVALVRTLTYWKPRLVLSWSPGKSTQLRLRGEREVGQISFYSFIANSEFNSGVVRAGNPDLRPDRAWVTEATIERQFWTGASGAVTLRHREVTDVVDVRRVGTAGAVGIGNIGDGAQTFLLANVTLPLKAIGLNGAMLRAEVARRHTRVIDPTTGVARRFSNIFDTAAEVHFAYDLPRRKLNLGVDAFYAGSMYIFRPFGQERGGPWFRMLLFVEYRARPNLTLRAEANNITNAKPTITAKNFAGVRDASPLLYVDERAQGLKPFVFVRARRTF